MPPEEENSWTPPPAESNPWIQPPVDAPVQTVEAAKPDSPFVSKFKKALGPVATALLVGWKYVTLALKALIPALKFLKLGSVLPTLATMALSVWVYQMIFGWKFAFGFVILIFIHEMGHVFVAWRQGLPISAPLFIPMMGAVILSKQQDKSAWEAALMGIGGPVGGTLGALACHGIYAATGNLLFLGLAYVGYWLNLFNLMPVFPLDGGWIVGSISPFLWLFGLIAMVVGFFLGHFHNPMIWIILIVSLPRLWNGIRYGKPMGSNVMAPATPSQKWIMGLSYVGLAAFLMIAMMEAHIDRPEPPKSPAKTPLASREAGSATALAALRTGS